MGAGPEPTEVSHHFRGSARDHQSYSPESPRLHWQNRGYEVSLNCPGPVQHRQWVGTLPRDLSAVTIPKDTLHFRSERVLGSQPLIRLWLAVGRHKWHCPLSSLKQGWRGPHEPSSASLCGTGWVLYTLASLHPFRTILNTRYPESGCKTPANLARFVSSGRKVQAGGCLPGTPRVRIYRQTLWITKGRSPGAVMASVPHRPLPSTYQIRTFPQPQGKCVCVYL